jgi:pilus assembly protein Flp/PilA
MPRLMMARRGMRPCMVSKTARNETHAHVHLRVSAELALKAADRKGVTTLEYGLLASLIAAVIVAAVTLLGSHVNGMLISIAGHV